MRGATAGDALGHYVLNVNDGGVFDMNGQNLFNGGLVGNGTVTSGVAGSSTLTVKNGFGVDTNFSGSITNGSGTVGLTKSQNGILTLSGHSTYTGGTTVQAGRVTNATGSTAVNGRLEAQTVTALGTGGVTLEGGTLRLNAANLLNGAQSISEVINGLDFLRWGGTNGLDITVSATSISNGITLPANTTTYINAATQNAGLNNLTVNAPIVTFAEGIIAVNGTSTFSQANTVLRTAGGRLFLAGKVDAGGNTITKTGANDVVLTNGATGSGQNNVGLWKVYGGLLEVRTADGDSNPLGLNATVEVNVGTNGGARGLSLLTDGDSTNNAELVTTYANTNLRFGSNLAANSSDFVSSGLNRVTTDRAFIANNSFKTVQINNLEVGGVLGSAFAYFALGNNDSIKVNGTTTFLRDMTIQVDGGQGLVLNGLISGNGTLNRRSNGGTLYINADNSITGGYDGGTFFTGGGRNYLGSILGNQVTLSDTAKLGKGHVWISSLATFQINSAGNLQTGQNFHVSGSLSWAGTLSLAADLSLDQIRLRSNGLGGIQDSSTDYFLNARNPSSGVLALGTVYTQAIDMRTLGDGMWFLGSMTNGIGANGAYDAATLKPGLSDTYRLGAGGSTLFLGTNGSASANVLTDIDASKSSSLVVGSPMTVQNAAAMTAGALVLLQNQNYTGATTVNRGSTLDFRGTLTTSGIETYGVLNVAGEAGTFINPNTSANIPVTLRPGSTLRFDNTTAGVLPVAATQGRWEDSVGFSLTDNVIRLQGNAAVEVVETVGAIDVVNGGNRLEVVRGVIGRGTELRTPAITRSGTGTLQFIHNGSQLGSDERVIVTGTAPTVTNGMVAPWMVSASDIQFLTYNADVGFTIAGFDRVQAAATLATTVTAPNDRTFFSGAVVLNAGVDFDTYALRLDGNVTLGTATDNTAELILRSGGLISNGTRTITSGIRAGSTGTSELILFNNGTTAIGDFANPNTAGLIAASSITKFGVGTLQLLGNNPGFTGDIRVQQGAVELNYRNTADVSTPIVATTIGGNGGNVILEGAGSTLNIRAGQDGTNVNFTGAAVTFNKGIVLSDFNPVGIVNVDRSAGAAATSQSKTIILGGGITFGQNNGDVGQILRLDLRNIFNLAVDGTTTLRGRSSLAVEDSSYGNTGASTVFLRGLITESAAGSTLIKGPSDGKTRTLDISHINALNNYTGGTVLQGGTLRVMARSNNAAVGANANLLGGGLGNGDITLMQGTLDLRLDGAASGAADGEIEFVRYASGSGSGPNLIVKGSTAINADRNNYTGTWTRTGTTVTATLPGGHGFASTQSVGVTTGYAAGNVTITGVSGNTFTYTVADSGATSGLFAVNNNSGSNKMLTFNNMSIGSEILTLSGGNGYGFAIAGTTTLLGNAFFNNGTDFVIGGGQGATGAANSVTTDGGQVLINKIGAGVLWVHSTNNNLTGPTYINAGLLDWGNRAVANNTATLGTGNIFVNAGASARTRAVTNINSGLGQRIVLTSTPYSSALYRPIHDVTQAQLQAIIGTRTTTSNEVTYLAFEGGTLNQNLDQSLLGDGRIYFGAIGARTFTGAATGIIVPGLANHTNAVVGGTSTNRIYRFGHNNADTLIINLGGTGNLNDVGGATDVQIGSLATLGLTNWNTGFVYFQDQNTYTGQTVVSRGLTLRFNTAMAAANAAGPLGANASSRIDIYGGLRFEGTGNLFQNGSTTTHFYNDIRLRPGSALTFQDMTATGGGANRWGDSVGINLDGAAIVAEATSNANDNTETIGSVIFDRGSRIQLTQEGTGDAFLTAASVARASASSGAGTGRGTLVFTPTATATFGVAATAGVAQTQFRSTAAITPSATSAVTGMLPGYYMESNGNRFVKNGANGITPVLDGDMVAMPTGAGAGTEVVNITAATTMGSFETSIFALRGGAFTLNSPTGANNDATITLTGSGADIGGVASAGAFVINPNLKFGATGTNEALFYTGSTLTINGNITAGSITKFGTGGTLVIANDQSDAARGTGNGYQGGWVVNEGAIQFNQFGSAGNAHVNNTIVLNAAQAGSAQLNLRAAPADTLLNYTYTSGRIIAVDNATIDWDPGADDRVHTIADVEIQQSGGIGNATANGTVDAQLRIANNRNRSILAAGTLTVTNNAILNVDTTAAGSPFAAYGGNGTYLTNGLSSGFSVASLVGSNRLTKWGDGTLYIRGDSSSTFSGPVVIDQGAVHVTHNGSLGTGAVTVNRYGVLDIGVAAFAATNSGITYNEGSIERWSVNNARTGTLNLGKGTLQVAANQPSTNVAVTLDGGGIEAFLRNDDLNGAQGGGGVMRILNSNVTFTLNSNSFIGTQYYLGANGLDNGKQAMDNMSLTEYTASGAILEVQGVISGAGGLTKVGYDTVILSGSNTYSGTTRVEGGRLLLGKDDALPTTTTLTTTSDGVLDLNGQNQTVGTLTNPGTPAAGVNSSSGFITNAATTVKTLTTGNGVTTNYTYSGVIQHNVALTKTGTATMTLNNANTYIGNTVITGGTLALGATGSINDSPWVNVQGAASVLDVARGGAGYSFDGKVSGGGLDGVGTTYATVANAAKINGNLTITDHIAEISGQGTMAPGASSNLANIATAGDALGHIYTNGNLTINGPLVGTVSTAVDRLALQITTATVNATTLGAFDYTSTWLTTNAASYLTSTTASGSLAGHDYVNIGGVLTLNQYGRVTVSNLGAGSYAGGDVFNLLDWTSLTNNSFSINPITQYDGTADSIYDLDLPELTNGNLWDTSLFLSHGVVFVVPEPSRALLLLFGLLGLMMRRRRQTI
jgi:autotransporter-associated beta strand protein